MGDTAVGTSSGAARLCDVGPIGVSSSTGWTPVRGSRVATIVALLSIAGEHGVRTDELIEAAWPGPDRPATARGSLANIVARLRSRFGSSFVETTGSGYRLGSVVESDRSVILDVAARLSDDVDGGDRGVAAAIDDAISRWRGEPWADVGVDVAEPDRARLHAARIRLLRARATMLSSNGRHDEAAAALDEVVGSNGATERDWFELVRALAASGRRADAIERIHDARRQLAPRGLDLGEELASLEASLLDGSWNAGSPTRTAEPLSPMLGRDVQLERLTQLIGRRRLVTVTGPGGVGKTRIAHELIGRHPHLAPVFVDLVPVREGRFVPAAVATALQADIEAAGSVVDAIVDDLRQRPRLVVLDNCEQIVDDVARLVEQLATRCADVWILSTSREPLQVDGEFVVRLPPLATAAGGDAVRLFFQRAAESGVDLDPEEWGATVAELCRRLDGLPLAIELAARRVVMLSPDEIVTGLVDRFELLRTTDSPSRHSALANTLMWSWDLLQPEDQHTLSRLSAFASGIDVDELGVALAREQWRAVDDVQRLRAKSLVAVESRPGRPSRAHLLESVRVLAIQQAEAMGIWATCRSAHRRWVDDYTERVVGTRGHDDRPVDDPLAHLDREASEIRAAVDWVGDDPERALGICARLVNWWRGRDLASYAIERFDELLDASGDLDPEVRCDALSTLVLMRRIAGHDDDRTTELTRAARQLVDATPPGPTRDRLELRYYEAAFDVDDQLLPGRIEAIIARAESTGEPVDTLATHLLSAWCVANEPSRAVAAAALGLELSDSVNVARQAHAWEQRGLAALANGDIPTAHHYLEGALERFDAIGQRFCAVHGCEAIAWLLTVVGRGEEGREVLAAAEGLRERHRRYRSGFEQPAALAAFAAIGGRPDPDPEAQFDPLIERTRRLLESSTRTAGRTWTR